jgi:hypothetical protein
MNAIRILTITCVLLAVCSILGAVSAYETADTLTAASKVYVSGVTFEPTAFFSDDIGTATISVTNGNDQLSSVVNHATFGDQIIRVTSAPYDSTTHLGPRQTVPFAFSFRAAGTDGIYYPEFSLSFRDAYSLHHRSMVEIDNRPLEITVTDMPDAFTQGKKKSVYLMVSNPRKNDVRNLFLDVSGDGIGMTSSRIYIGDLAHSESVPVNFSITPDKETTAVLTLNYDNGKNPHTVTKNIPVLFGTDKKLANPVMNNIEVKSDGAVFHVTGDVNNAGLETAKSVTVSTLSPAVPQDPHKMAVVGALKPDDFGSFEVTFMADPLITTVPIQVSYKDAEGNIYSAIQDVRISSGTPVVQKTGDTPVVPVIAGIIILVVFMGGVFVYSRKSRK